ncbi:hypothetical protein BGW36DRAFT_76069 [Talaromyces proteolyticus]|uniref:SHSP domain-containing protein n=1 Tax=Talaromyces proteolyticus TaxID=1131652 RepID=A0AAD4KCW9_9EURO|nr:uncharacterized protein BGW36DRAFT_76069 [Talaromyces proteolyticus]KAH8689004.1 hypothetical protein BGW36DRAFT_76069 [Talaromyces proteolyticus]
MSAIRYHTHPASLWEYATNTEPHSQGSSQFPCLDPSGNARNEANDGYCPWPGAWGCPPGLPFSPQSRQDFFNQHRNLASAEQEAGHEDDQVKEQAPNEGQPEPRGPPPPFTEQPHPWQRPHDRRRDFREHGLGNQARDQYGLGPGGSFNPANRWALMNGFGPTSGMPGGFGPWGWPGNNFGGFGHWNSFRPMGGASPWGVAPAGAFGPWGNFAPWARFGSFGNSNPMPQGGSSPLNPFGFEDGMTRDRVGESKPQVDVFDTPESYVVCLSLPGARKEDIEVTWDSKKYELNIAGSMQRPGDEQSANKESGQNKNKVGTFEERVRLGSRANSSQIDTDMITARMEGGVLIINAPKLDSGFVEIKKVDIE